VGYKKNDVNDQANELLRWAGEIDELKSMATGNISESKGGLPNESEDIRTKIETARDKLMQVFLSIRDKDSVD